MSDWLNEAKRAHGRLDGIAIQTPLVEQPRLSNALNSRVFLKREDLQEIRSYKIRGAYNKIVQLNEEERRAGIVCASAGNHAQGVAYSCAQLGIHGVIFMPQTTPKQKINQVTFFGKDAVEIRLVGDTFDDAQLAATKYCSETKATYVHPFDDVDVIFGQATVALEILQDAQIPIDVLIFPVGGGGLAAGICQIFAELSPHTRLIAVEPEGAASLSAALHAGKPVSLESIDKFVDGAAVRRIGQKNFELLQHQIQTVIQVPEGKVCSAVMQMYNEDGMVVELAGALSIAALDLLSPAELKGKNIVCVVSGSNNDILRTEEIRQKALLYEGLKHYFMVEFPQRPGALKSFVSKVLGEQDDITYFQFAQKNHRESGPAVVGIQVQSPSDFNDLSQRMRKEGFAFTYLNEHKLLFEQLVG